MSMVSARIWRDQKADKGALRFEGDVPADVQLAVLERIKEMDVEPEGLLEAQMYVLVESLRELSRALAEVEL